MGTLNLSIFVFVLLVSASVSFSSPFPATKYLSSIPKPVNIECMLENCAASAAGCLLDVECRSAVACANKCWNDWDKDNTSEKYHVQNCSNTCAFSYKGNAYVKFMTCVGDHKCVQFPPIPSQCKAPDGISILKKLSTVDFKGSWWAVAGRHPVYDCYPCQHIYIEQLNATSLKYVPKYNVYLENGSLALMDEAYVIPTTQPGSPISFVYHDTGLYHKETWYPTDGASDGSYILLYYCGNTLEWYYDGFLVFSRTRTLPDSSYTTIANSIRTATGLDLSSFCKPQTEGCKD